jgi:hypothetical protein
MAEHYSFHHLSFQAYLASRELRSQAHGHLTLVERREDPFWREANILYAEQGDITELVRALLELEENVVFSNLLLAADCWTAEGSTADREVAKELLLRLQSLILAEAGFLAEQALVRLARTADPEAKAIFKRLLRDDTGRLRRDSRAARFAVAAFGEATISEIIQEVVLWGFSADLMANFNALPRGMAVDKLEALALRTDWPDERSLGYDPGVRHIRRNAAQLMASIGEELAIPGLSRLLRADQLSSFEKSGVVAALAAIDDPVIRSLVEDILDGHSEIDCRIEAARQPSIIAKMAGFSLGD